MSSHTHYASYEIAKTPLLAARLNFFKSIQERLLNLSKSNSSLSGLIQKYPGHVINPSELMYANDEGWLTITENGYRPFRLTILQMGRWFRVGVKLNPEFLPGQKAEHDMLMENLRQHLQDECGHGGRAVMCERGDELLLDLRFDVPDLYTNVVTQETYIYLPRVVFTTALMMLTARG